MTRTILLALGAMLVVPGSTTHAADQVVLGKKLAIKDPTGLETNRSISISGKEKLTDLGALTDPTVGGATLTVIANGTSGTSQSYVLDAGGWKPTGTTGFKYVGPTGGDGDPVKQVAIKKSGSGTASIKVQVSGKLGTQSVDVVPPNTGTDGGFTLVIGANRYCVALGGAAGGKVLRNTAQSWQIATATAEAGCPSVPPTTTTTTLPHPSPLCPMDPSRTAFAGGPNTSACHQFDNDHDACERAFHIGQCGPSSCFYDFQSGDCNGCGPNNVTQGRCVNTCTDGPPSCPGDPTRTIFAGFSNSAACHNLDFSQSLCEKAFHIGGDGTVASCFYDPNIQECLGCGPNNFNANLCQNTCPVCAGDPSHSLYAGGPGSGGCHKFDASPDSCMGAFVIGDNRIANTCFYDNSSPGCFGCGPNNQANQQCVNGCPTCPQDPARQIYLGGPGTSPCHTFDNSPSLCAQSFILGDPNCPTLTSCYYDFNYGSCNGCGPSNLQNGACHNVCTVPICGDGAVDLANEQCDIADQGTCGPTDTCSFDCQCQP